MILKRWSMPATERDARVELAAAYRFAFDLGWTDLGATHFSMRVPGEPDAYLLLRECLFFNEVTASNLVKLGLDGSVRTDGVTVNPAGVTIHAALLAGKPELHSVMHTHTIAGVAVCSHPDGLLPLSQHALRFYDDVGRHDYEGVALDGEEGPRLIEHLADHELLLLDNHGLLTAGANVPMALSAMYYAEVACQMQVATLSATSNPVVPHVDTCTFTKKQHDDGHGYMYRDWMAILRQVERKHPAFAD
jgi:ribulose-5-phosphate 4-epimerase/fuculose-1-phosphate aldolase